MPDTLLEPILNLNKMKFNINIVFLLLLGMFFGCSYDKIPEPSDCGALPSIEISNVIATSCGQADGAFTANLNIDGQEVAFSLDGLNFQNNGVFSGLTAGQYEVTAKTSGGCSISSQVEINNQGGFAVNAETNPASCNQSNGNITLSPQGGVAPYSYRIDDSDFQSNGIFEDLAAGSYTVITKDATGCEFSQIVEVSNEVVFSEVKSIINNNCAISGCHAGNISPDFRNDNTIISRAGRIKARTSNQTMPPASSGLSLSAEEIDKISCWADSQSSN